MIINDANLPAARVPLADNRGNITSPWYHFLLQVFRRTGAAQTGPVQPLATFDAVRQTNNLWRFSWTFGATEQNGQEAAGVRLRYRTGAWSEYSDLTSALHTSGVLTVSPWDISVPEADGVYTFGAVPVGIFGDEGDPILIFAMAPDTEANLLSDNAALFLKDSNSDFLIDNNA